MLDDLFRPEAGDVLSVTALTRRIKGRLEGAFGRIWVQGEVSNLRRQSSGHVYFSLKDVGSQLPCALFARDAAAQSFQLEDGMEVLLFGDISVYEPHGRYQLIAKMAVRGGQGRLHLEFERLKKKLAAEGLFDRERKRPLPAFPQRIAVVTSPSGAALRDFLRILKRLGYRGAVTILPARVQGKGAAAEIAAMLEHAEQSSPAFDLVVLTRGGGGIEDLWPFNEEPLARAVAACRTPVISAVGHEIDTVLTDLAADVRAETPSGAAERIAALHLDCIDKLDTLGRELLRAANDRRDRLRQTLAEWGPRLQLANPARRIERLGMRVDDFENRLVGALRDRIHGEHRRLGRLGSDLARQHPIVRIRAARRQCEDRRRRMRRAFTVALGRHKEALGYLRHRLDHGSIQSSLRRGYAILTDPGGKVLTRAEEARKHPSLRARLQDGELTLRTDEKAPDKDYSS